jgi:hypothetical protein
MNRPDQPLKGTADHYQRHRHNISGAHHQDDAVGFSSTSSRFARANYVPSDSDAVTTAATGNGTSSLEKLQSTSAAASIHRLPVAVVVENSSSPTLGASCSMPICGKYGTVMGTTSRCHNSNPSEATGSDVSSHVVGIQPINSISCSSNFRGVDPAVDDTDCSVIDNFLAASDAFQQKGVDLSSRESASSVTAGELATVLPIDETKSAAVGDGGNSGSDVQKYSSESCASDVMRLSTTYRMKRKKLT